MRLAAAAQDDVVRNANNGSHYRFDRTEKSMARIRPLELFPTGRLVPKPTDTLVSAEIEVLVVGRWADGMRVAGASRSLDHYRDELLAQQERLVALEAEYEALPQDGVGRLSRGSFANKVKNCRMRIAMLIEGLEIGPCSVPAPPPVVAAVAPAFVKGDIVQLGSGLPGRVMSASPARGVAVVRTRLGEGRLEAPVPFACLRPWAQARLATA